MKSYCVPEIELRTRPSFRVVELHDIISFNSLFRAI